MLDINIVDPDKNCDQKSLATHIEEEKLKKQAKNARELFSMLQDELDSRENDLKDGLSFLDMKNDTLLSYMIDVCNIVLLKVRNQSIQGHRSIERSVEYRVILDKIKTINQRLAYQLNKTIAAPVEQEERVDVSNLDIDLDDGDDDDDEDDEEEEKDDSDASDGEEQELKDDDSGAVAKNDKKKVNSSGNAIYKPPKLRSVPYYDSNQSTSKTKEDDLVQVYERDKERTRYEEENYTRLPDRKPKKKRRKH